jgi:hypothetical protein
VTVRRAAAGATGCVGARAAVEPLIDMLQSAGDYSERWHAAVALGKLGDQRAVVALARRLSDRRVRWAVVRALGEIGGAEAYAALRELHAAVWRPMLRRSRREALDAIERADAQRAGLVRTPLVSVFSSSALTTVTRVLAACIVATVAIVAFDARPAPLVLVLGLTTVCVSAWVVWRLPPRVLERWIPAAQDLPAGSPEAEPWASTLARIAVDGVSTALGGLAVVWVAARIVPVEVAAGLMAGLFGWPVTAREAWTVRRWQREHHTKLLRERVGVDPHQHRFFTVEHSSANRRAADAERV